MKRKKTYFADLVDAIVVWKTEDQENPSDDMVDDTQVKFSVGANEVWRGTCHLRYNRGAGGSKNITFMFNVPAGAVCYASGATSDYEVDRGSIYISAGSRDAPAVQFYHLHFLYIGGGTAGTVALRWGRKAGDTVSHFMKMYSHIVAHRLKVV